MAHDRPVPLTVSDLRNAIFAASGNKSEGAGSLAGQIFHRVAAAALQEGHPASWKMVLSDGLDAESLDAEKWIGSLYEQVLGPELTRLQPSSLSGGEVLVLWRGVQSFAHWFRGLLEEAMKSGVLIYDRQNGQWQGADALFLSEREASKTFSHPGWSRDVAVSGRLDQLIRLGTDRWCVVEYKLGDGHKEADALQSCLYHELLGGDGGSAAIRHFGGEAENSEIVIDGESIAQARPALLALIGALAGVAQKEAGVSPTPPDGSETNGSRLEWPKKPNADEIEIGKKLVRALQEYNAEAKIVGDPLVGPAFVRYLLEPARGVPASRIIKQGENLRVRLEIKREPIIGHAEGRIAVDVPRPMREVVAFGSLASAMDAKKSADGNACVLAGVDLKGTVHFIDLARQSPHLLVGGEPGSGKSEWLRSAVASLVVTNDPSTLRLVLVDPKRNAFTELANSPFLWHSNSLNDSQDGSSILLMEEIIEEIGRRNDLFKQASADDLAHCRRKTGAAPPRIVCVVDEFAELSMTAGRANKRQQEEFERAFVRIAAIGRAAGVHLILATQHPSHEYVPGILKANLTGKIALRVGTQIASKVLLDQSGAQNLLGKGDLLLSTGGEPIRLQSPWLSEEERLRLFRRAAIVTAPDGKN